MDTKARFFRGNIWQVNLDINVVGSEIRKGRPCVVVSTDVINQMKGNMLAVVPITDAISKLTPDGKLRFPMQHVLIPATTTNGLDKDSVAICEQVRSIDQTRLIKKRGQVSSLELNAISDALTWVLDLYLD